MRRLWGSIPRSSLALRRLGGIPAAAGIESQRCSTTSDAAAAANSTAGMVPTQRIVPVFTASISPPAQFEGKSVTLTTGETVLLPPGWDLYTYDQMQQLSIDPNHPTEQAAVLEELKMQWPPLSPPRPDYVPASEAGKNESKAAVGELWAKRTLLMGEYGELYRWMGRAMSMAESLDLTNDVRVEWFFSEIRVWLRLSPKAAALAAYMTQEELVRAPRKNMNLLALLPVRTKTNNTTDVTGPVPSTEDSTSGGATSSSSPKTPQEVMESNNSHTVQRGYTSAEAAGEEDDDIKGQALPDLDQPPNFGDADKYITKELLQKASHRAMRHFAWCLKPGKKERDSFTSETYMQWYHRADYLVNRKSRQKKEFRNNLTFEQLLQDTSQRRRRRNDRRTAKEKEEDERKQRLESGKGTKEDVERDAGLVADVLPREMREQLMSEDQDDAKVQGRGFTGMSFRTNPFA